MVMSFLTSRIRQFPKEFVFGSNWVVKCTVGRCAPLFGNWSVNCGHEGKL